MEQAKRICKAYGLAFVARLQYITACLFKIFKQDDKAELFLLETYKTTLKAMNWLEEWNDNRRVLDLETSFKIGFYQASVETIIQELENK